MNAIFLHLPDGTPTKWSMCSECKRVAAPGNLDISERCCTCTGCGEPLPPNERTPYSTAHGSKMYHDKCEQERRMRHDAEVLEKAVLVTDYGGPVYLDRVGNGSYGDGYFADVEELSEHLDFHDGERPLFAHCCTSRGFNIDLDQILENATEEMFEDCYDHLSGVDELSEAVDAFNKVNESVFCWDADYKRKVAIPTPPSEARPEHHGSAEGKVGF